MKKKNKKEMSSESLVDELLDEAKIESDKKTRFNVRDHIPDAPVSKQCVLPYGYAISKHWLITKKNDDEDKDQYITPCPLFITGRGINPKTNEETIQLSWIRDNAWKSIEFERRYICKASLLVDLSNFGLPVTSESAKQIIDYLRLYEATNIEYIPRIEITHQFGWNKNNTCFLIETDARQFTIKPCNGMWLVYIFSIEIDGGEHERAHIFQAWHCRLCCCPSQA